jgi:hypothetical protein
MVFCLYLSYCSRTCNPETMENDNIVKIEIRTGEFYDFFESPPEPLRRGAGYMFLITRKFPGSMNHDFLYIGTSFDLPKLLKKKEVVSFFESNKATHLLIFRVDDPDEMLLMKEEITSKYPSVRQEMKPARRRKVSA